MTIHVLQSVKKETRRKKERQKRKFKKVYNKTKPYKWKDLKEINMRKHFYFPKIIAISGGVISKAALAIYPVLCSKADFEENKPFQISRDHIAALAGISIPTVDKAIENLLSSNLIGGDDDEDEYNPNAYNPIPLLTRKKVTKDTRHFYIYQVGFIRKNMIEDWRKHFFIFHICIIESKVWATLSLRAKVLYLTMRENAHFNPELYSYIEPSGKYWLGGDYPNSEFYDGIQYRERRWDVCNVSLTRLCKMSRMDPSGMKKVVNELEEHKLIEQVDRGLFKVYLKPRRVCNPL